MKKTIYLARLGKVYGPIGETEVQGLRASGRIMGFSWIWDGASQAWQPVDPAPAPLTEGEWADRVASSVETVLSQVTLPTASVHEVTPTGPLPVVPSGPSPMDLGFHVGKGTEIPVIGYNARQFVSGMAIQMNSSGCDFHTTDCSYAPTFVVRSPIILNLLEPASGHLVNMSARVSAVTRSPKGWVYQVRWEQRAGLSRAA